MPNMTNVTVKNAANTDVVYVALTPSAGDSVAAQWRSDSQASLPMHRPSLAMSTRFNGGKTARRAELTFAFPFVYADASGQLQSKDKVVASISVVIPQGIPQTVINDSITQLGNLLVASLIGDSLKSGYAPT